MITWNNAYESEPSDESYIFALDNDIRELKRAITERFEKEHIWKVGDTDGQHIPGKIRAILYDTETNILTFSGYVNAIGFASDTKNFYRCNGGVSWTKIQLDHGSLSDLGLDENTAYLKADGSRLLSGNLSLNSNKITNLLTPALDGDLAKKRYIDDKRLSYYNKVLMYYGNFSNEGYLQTYFQTFITKNFNVPDDTAKIFIFASSYGYGYYTSIQYGQILIDDVVYLSGKLSDYAFEVGWKGFHFSRFIDSESLSTGPHTMKLQFKCNDTLRSHFIIKAHLTILVIGLQ